ncbi:MAG: hypothetical protein E7329_01720 [Clostridiales bacterium]|nr:hypothetical protein [Clostridiales bacterium]
MRRWMLQGAPVMMLASLGMHAGGGATGLLLWLWLGVKLLPQGRYSYPRKRKGNPGRLFLSFSAAAFLPSLAAFLFQSILPKPSLAHTLMLWGTILFSLSFSSRLLLFSLSQRFSYCCGGILCCLLCFFTVYT